MARDVTGRIGRRAAGQKEASFPKAGTVAILRERLKPAETLPGLALWELGVSLAARVARSAKRNSTYWESDFLSGPCHRVVDSDLEHGTALLELLRSRPSPSLLAYSFLN